MNLEHNPESSCFSQTSINELWENQLFQQKIRTFFEDSHRQIENSKIVTSSNQKLQSMDSMVQEIGTMLTQNFRENVYKQSNQLFTSNMFLAQQIDKIKNTLQKINGQTITKVKTETSTAEKEKHDQSLFFDQEQDVQIVNLRKNNSEIEQKMGSLSFINSFVADVSTSPKKEEQINDKINASISKIQESLETKISQLQIDFTRRIEQIMKTIRHLIGLMQKQQKNITTKNIEVKIGNQNKKDRKEREKEKSIHEDKKNESFLNKSHNKISAFFRLGGNS